MQKKITKNSTQVQLFHATTDKATIYNQGYIQNISAGRIRAMEAVIQKLRDNDLKEGHCFMVTDRKLPVDEAYYLYPDGRIKIEQVNLANIDLPRTVIKVLNKTETEAIRKNHAFLK